MTILSALTPRWRKVLADLWDNKMRTFLVVASIAVGIFAVGTIGHSFVIISQDMNVSYAAAQPANIEIWTSSFDDKLVDTIKDLPGVADAEGRAVIGIRLSDDGQTWKSHDLVALDDYAASSIYLRTPSEGKEIPGRHELVLEKNVFTNSDYQLGDQLTLQLTDGSVERSLPVTGIVLDQAGGGGDYTSQPKVFATMDTLEWVGQPRAFNRLLARISGDSNDQKNIDAVAKTIEDKLEKSGRPVFQTKLLKTHEHPMATTVEAMLAVQTALAIMIMLLSSSLIANTLNALLSQHLRQIGIMKLVGARSRQIMAMYLVLILAFGIIALLIAVPLGIIAGNGLAESLSSQLNIKIQGFRVIPEIVILQVLGALLIPLIAGIVPVNHGAKTTVRRAISDTGAGAGQSTANWLTHLGEWLRWLSRPVLLSIRNTFRRKGRLALTLFTLIMAGAIFIAVFNVQASLYGFLDQLGRHFIADVMVSFERPYRIAKVQQTLYELPFVEKVEGWTATTAEIMNPDGSVARNLTIIAPPADTPLIEPEIMAGRWILPGETQTVAVGDAIYDVFPDLQPGDTIALKVQGDKEEEWTVSGVFRFTNQLTDVFGYADYESIARMQTSPDQAPIFRIDTTAENLDEQREHARLVDEQLRAGGFSVSGVDAGLATLTDASEGINILIGFLFSMALLTALVGSIGLTGTMGMNVLERTREIGVMRAIGAVDSQIMKSVIVEGMVIGFMSWAAGAVLSFPISYVLLDFLSIAFSAPIPMFFTINGFIIWLVAVLALSAIASVIPARSAARLTIREVLAYE